MTQTRRRPTLLEALLPLVFVASFLGVGFGVFRLNTEILLLTAAAVTALLARRLGCTYKDIERGILNSIHKGTPAALIVIAVGAVIGSWIASGTIPMLIYYGLEFISPTYFLATACIVCSIVSLTTGTSYGTAGTVGVALIGVAQGLGVPLGQAAGAIIAGAYFGDKMSPFSDMTNLASAVAKSNLFDHIKHMLWTTTPAWILGVIVYFFIGASGDAAAASLEQTALIKQTILDNFQFHPVLLLPPVMIVVAAVRKKPIIPSMFAASFVAALLAIWVQSMDLQAAFGSMTSGYQSQTDNEMIDSLLSRGGMAEMMNIVLLLLCAFSFGGVVQAGGMLDVVLERLQKTADSTAKLIASTVASSLASCLMTGSAAVSTILIGELFAPAFRKMELAAKNLSRTLEDSGTVVVPLIPWSIAGFYMSRTLGVATLEYAPWMIMCYTGFIFALIYGFTGFKIAPQIKDDETEQGS